MHLHVSAACGLYDAPDGWMCITSETCRARKKCNKITLDNLHQAGPDKPMSSHERITFGLLTLAAGF